MVNATLGNIKQDSMPKKLPGLSRNRPQVTVPLSVQSGKQRKCKNSLLTQKYFRSSLLSTRVVEPEKRRPEIRLCPQASARTEDACCPASLVKLCLKEKRLDKETNNACISLIT